MRTRSALASKTRADTHRRRTASEPHSPSSSATARLRALHTESGDVVLDMSETTFVDSTAIGVIVASWKRHHEEGRRFVARDLPESTLHVFELTGVDELLVRPGGDHEDGSGPRA
jgi:anti-anti-sigma regulatory factor